MRLHSPHIDERVFFSWEGFGKAEKGHIKKVLAIFDISKQCNCILFEVSPLQSKLFWHFVYFDLLDLLADFTSTIKCGSFVVSVFTIRFTLFYSKNLFSSWNWHQGSASQQNFVFANQQNFCSRISKTFVRRCRLTQNLAPSQVQAKRATFCSCSIFVIIKT